MGLSNLEQVERDRFCGGHARGAVREEAVIETRQLMLNENLDAGSAAVRVGYENASQFSREYSRLFGAPPQRDITRMRARSRCRRGRPSPNSSEVHS